MFFLLSFKCVQGRYTSGGWTLLRDHMLEYGEIDAENHSPSISLSVTEPANDEENNWNVTVISPVSVSYTYRL